MCIHTVFCIYLLTLIYIYPLFCGGETLLVTSQFFTTIKRCKPSPCFLGSLHPFPILRDCLGKAWGLGSVVTL